MNDAWRIDSKAKRLLAGLIAAAAMTALMLAIKPAAAQAGDVCSAVPGDGSVVCLRFNHDKIDVCDRQVDGHRAYARRLLINGNYANPLYDNDPGSGCSRYNFDKIFMLKFAGCVQYEGCGVAWARTWQWGPNVHPW